MRGDGEREYRSKFKIKPIFSRKQDLLIENLYKTAINLDFAYEYHAILVYLHETEREDEVTGTLLIMSVISFSMMLRKTVDHKSKCNLRKLINLAYSGEEANRRINIIDDVYSKYKSFIDKFIAHQDRGLIANSPEVPGYIENRQDLDQLNTLYKQAANRVCSAYLPIQTDHKRKVALFRERLA